MHPRFTVSLLLIAPLLLGIRMLQATDPGDAALLTNPPITSETQTPPPPAVSTSVIAPAPGSTLADALAKLSKANDEFIKELSPLVDKFPTYTQSGVSPQGRLRITGADTLGPLMVRAAGAYKRIFPDAAIDFRQGGALKGLQELQAGDCEIAAVSRDLSPEEVTRIEKETGRKVFTAPIALGAVCVYVNADNPIKGLTKAQCNGAFSMEHSMTATPIIRWNQLDPTSPMGSSAAPLYTQGKLSGTLQIFQRWCMPGENFTTINRFIEPGPSSVVNACCAYPAAIGIAGFAQKQPRARALPLASGPGSPYVAPTVASIRKGTYPMRQRMHIVFLAPNKDQIPALTRDFLRFLLSQDGQDMVAKNGLIPVDPSVIPEFLGMHANGRWH